MNQLIKRREADGVVVINLDRPPVNALDRDALEAFIETFTQLAEAPPRVGLVIASSGGHFSAGLDLKVFRTGDQTVRKGIALAVNRLIAPLYALPFPVVAAIEGACLAGGLVIALGCDARIAADKGVNLGLPEVTAGVPFPLGALEVCRAELSAQARRQLMLHDRRVDGPGALEMGVVDALSPAATIEEAAIEKARALASGLAYRDIKQQLRAPVLAAIRAGLANGDPVWGA